MRFIIVPPALPTAPRQAGRETSAGIRPLRNSESGRANQPVSIVVGPPGPDTSSRRRAPGATWSGLACGRARRWPANPGTRPGSGASDDPGAHNLQCQAARCLLALPTLAAHVVHLPEPESWEIGSPCKIESFGSRGGPLPFQALAGPGVEQMVLVADAHRAVETLPTPLVSVSADVSASAIGFTRVQALATACWLRLDHACA